MWPVPQGLGEQDWILLPKRTAEAYDCAQVETHTLTCCKQVKYLKEIKLKWSLHHCQHPAKCKLYGNTANVQKSVCIHFLGMFNKLPPIWWPATTSIYCLTVLEAGSSKSRCWHAHPTSRGSWGELITRLSASFWWLQVLLLGLWPHHPNLCFHLHIASYSSGCVSSLCLIRHLSMDLGATQITQNDLFFSRSLT